MKIAPTLALLALSPLVAFAQESTKTPDAETAGARLLSNKFRVGEKTQTPEPVVAKSDKIGLFVIGYGAYQAPADLTHGGTGTVQRTVWDGEIIYTGPVGDDTTVDLDYEAKWTHNRFSAGAPYGDTESHFMGAHAVHMFEKTWGAGVVGAVELASETAADLMGDGVRGGAGASVMWKPSDTLSLETGASIQTQFGQKPTPSPYIRWKWLASKNLELEFRATGLQNGFAGTWFITDNKATSVRVSLFYENQQYALREGAGADGVAIREIPLRVTFTQFLSESFFVAVRAEAMLFHREGFYRNNDKVGVFQTDFAPGIGLMAGLRL